MKPQLEKETLKIPIEIFLDVCKMFYNGDMNNRIIGTNEVLGEVLVEIKYQKANKIQMEAVSNIYEVILEWNEQRYGNENPDEIFLA